MARVKWIHENLECNLSMNDQSYLFSAEITIGCKNCRSLGIFLANSNRTTTIVQLLQIQHFEAFEAFVYIKNKINIKLSMNR